MKKLNLRQIWSDAKGATAVEFALITPPFLVLLLGTMDFGHSIYMRATVEGALQEASRDSGLESGAVLQGQQIIDQKIKDAILNVAKDANVTITRRYYKTFTQASAAAKEVIINDTNGLCDPGEEYWDANNNSRFDEDGADDGQGGAQDVVIITASVDYPRLFPLDGMIGLPTTVEVDTNSVLANQPYGEQSQNGPAVQRKCPGSP